MEDSSDPIRIPLHNWSSQLVGAEVVGGILEEAGFSVEYVPSDSQVVYQSMCDGDIELVHEVWEGAFGVAFQEQVDKGCVLDWATHNAVTREEWWYPSYVEEQCPGRRGGRGRQGALRGRPGMAGRQRGPLARLDSRLEDSCGTAANNNES